MLPVLAGCQRGTSFRIMLQHIRYRLSDSWQSNSVSLGRGKTMRSSRDDDGRFESALWGHGGILMVIGLLAALMSFPAGW